MFFLDVGRHTNESTAFIPAPGAPIVGSAASIVERRLAGSAGARRGRNSSPARAPSGDLAARRSLTHGTGFDSIPPLIVLIYDDL